MEALVAKDTARHGFGHGVGTSAGDEVRRGLAVAGFQAAAGTETS